MKRVLKNKVDSSLLARYEVVNNLFSYITGEVANYSKELNKSFLNVSDEIIYNAYMVYYLSKEAQAVYDEWKDLRRKIFYEGNKN